MGFNSHLTAKGIFQQDSFNLNLTSVDGPGDFFIWASSIDGIDVSYNSADGLGELDVMKFPARGHFHKNLGFNSPGTHLLGFTATGVLADSGITTKSDEYFVKYEVNVLSEGEVDLEIVYEDGKLGAEILAVVHDDHGDDDHGDDDHGDDDHGDDDHDDNETHDDHGDNETHDDEEYEFALTPEDVLMMFDTNNDSLLSFDEFWHSWEEEYEPESYCYDMVSDEIMDHIIEEECVGDELMWVEVTINDHEEHHVAFATLHIEEEGDYGFALPSGIEYFILMGEGGHGDHDDHGHDDHGDDHGDDEDHSDEEDHSDDGGGIVADEDEEAFDYDPHSWLSPVAYKAQIDVVLNALVTTFPEGEADFKANAEAYSVELDTLDANYTAAFGVGGTCEASNTEKTIVANHNAYAYISERYDIEILTVHGLDPEGEPSPADIAEVVEQIEEKNLTVLYVEEYTSTSSVDSIVEQTGVTIKILYTMELPPKDSEDTYLTLMNKNLNSLVEGMGC
jgi:zinc transport system substrate-binding protein